MKSLLTLTVLLGALALTLPAQAGYGYLAVGADKDGDGDAPLSIVSFSTLNACQSAAGAAANAVQDCFSTCNLSSPNSEYVMLEQGDKDGDGRSFEFGVGPYGYLADCDAGIADAEGRGMSDISSECVLLQVKKACK